MTIRLFNTLTKTKDVFAPIDPANVRMYVCGPTVYDFAHIGNARPAIVFDVLYRLLRHTYGADHVTYVRNITDVDDKINARALRDFPDLPLNQAIRAVTEKTEQQYHADTDALGCLRPTHEPRATDNIQGMIAMIQTLLDKDFAYVAQGAEGRETLFDIVKMREYGQLSGRKLEDQLAGARVEAKDYKRNPGDFVLWKESNADEPGWDATFHISDANREELRLNANTIGIRGRPGWHIECSAMSAAYLGNVFDIHGGGLDLIFPHHENEIAQSRCAHGTPVMANVWMHNGFLQVEGEKMSKSLGNFVTIRELMRGWSGQAWTGGALRLTMLKAHYRQPIDWTSVELHNSREELGWWTELLQGNRPFLRNALSESDAGPSADLIEALSDDLNTPQALRVLREDYALGSRGDTEAVERLARNTIFLGLFNTEVPGAYALGVRGYEDLTLEIVTASGVLVKNYQAAIANNDISFAGAVSGELQERGLRIEMQDAGPRLFSSEQSAELTVGKLIEARNAARKAKNFAESDRIRDDLLAQGIILKDGPQGTTWEVKK